MLTACPVIDVLLAYAVHQQRVAVIVFRDDHESMRIRLLHSTGSSTRVRHKAEYGMRGGRHS